MGGLLRPFPQIVAPNKVSVPLGVNRIAQQHPLARNLVGAFLPGVTGGLNLSDTPWWVNNSKDKIGYMTPGITVSPEGPALTSGLNRSFYPVATMAQGASQFTNSFLTQATLFWRGHKLAASTSGRNRVWGLVSSDGLTNESFVIIMNGNSINICYETTPGSPHSYTAYTYTPVGSTLSVGFTFDGVANELYLYVNGSLVYQTVGAGGGYIYLGDTANGITEGLCFNSAYSTGSGINCNSYCGYFWNRMLTAQEHASLARAPYDMIVGPEVSLPTIKVPLSVSTPAPTVYDFAEPGPAVYVMIYDDAHSCLYAGVVGTNSVYKISPGGVCTLLAGNTVINTPNGMCLDSSGNLYVVNNGANTITKISPTGVVTPVWANTGTLPYAITCDSVGNVYCVNYSANTLMKFNTSGTLLNTYTVGHGPQAVICDSSDNVYVANNTDNTISKITSGGVVTVAWATTGSGPSWLAWDSHGNLYCSNNNVNTVTQVTPSAVSSVYATVGSGPVGVIFDASDNMYVANYNDSTVSIVYSDRTVQTFSTEIGSNPVSIAKDSTGNIYIGASGTDPNISVIALGTFPSPPALVASSVYGSVGTAPGFLAFDSDDNLYCANATSKTITKIDTLKRVSTFATLSDTPKGLAIDRYNDSIYVAATSSVLLLDRFGKSQTFAALTATSIAIDELENVYLVDSATGNAWIVPSKAGLALVPSASSPGVPVSIGSTGANPVALTLNTVNQPSIGYTANSSAGTVSKLDVSTNPPTVTQWASGFGQPSCIACDTEGNVYCGDFTNSKIWKIDVNQNVTTFASSITNPQAMAFDSKGNLFVADYNNNQVFQISPNGLIRGVISTVGTHPSNVAVDRYNNVFTANQSDNTVSYIPLGTTPPLPPYQAGGARHNLDVLRISVGSLQNPIKVPSDSTKVDWRHPLANGLVAAWLPGTCGVNNLALRTSHFLQSHDGITASNEAYIQANQLDRAFPEGPSVVQSTPVALVNDSNPGSYSLFWRGYYNASNFSLLSATIFGIIHSVASGGSPVFALQFDNNKNIAASVNGNVVARFNTGGAAPYLGAMSCALVFDSLRGYITLYVNGVRQYRAYISSLAFTAGDNVVFSDGNMADSASYAGYIWRKTLSDQEMLALHLAPYSLFTSKEPPLSILMTPPKHPTMYGGNRRASSNVLKVFTRRLNPRPTQLPIGAIGVDRRHPLTDRLAAAYLPGVTGGLNLANNPWWLTPNGQPSGNMPPGVVMSPEGPALNTAVNAASPRLAQGVPGIRTITQASLFWRGYRLGVASPGRNRVWGFVNGGSGSYESLLILMNGSSVNYCYMTYPGQYFNVHSYVGYSLPAGLINQAVSIGLTFDGIAGNMTLYVNGTVVSTNALNSVDFYPGGPTPSIWLGGFGSYGSFTSDQSQDLMFNLSAGNINATSYCGYLWGRALSAEDHFALAQAPYDFLVGPEYTSQAIRTPPPHVPVTYTILGPSIMSKLRVFTRFNINENYAATTERKIAAGFTNVAHLASSHPLGFQSGMRLQGVLDLQILNAVKVSRVTRLNHAYSADVDRSFNIFTQSSLSVSSARELPHEFVSFIARPIPHLNVSYRAFMSRSMVLQTHSKLDVSGGFPAVIENRVLIGKSFQLNLLSFANMTTYLDLPFYNFTNNSAPVTGNLRIMFSSQCTPKSSLPLPFMSLPTTNISGYLYVPIYSASVFISKVNFNTQHSVGVLPKLALQTQSKLQVIGTRNLRHNFKLTVSEKRKLRVQNASRLTLFRAAIFESTMDVSGTRRLNIHAKTQVTGKRKVNIQSLITSNITILRRFRLQSTSTLVPMLRIVDVQSTTLPITPETTRIVQVPAATRLVEAAVGASPNFTPCDEGDQDIYTFDFEGRLIAGETLLNAGTWIIDVTSGSDPNPQAHIIGVPTLSGTQITAIMGEFLANRVYQIIVVVNTSHGRILKSWNYLTCNQVLNG